MLLRKEGFKTFTSDALERVLQNSTYNQLWYIHNYPHAIKFSCHRSAGLISLYQARGLELKVKISTYPMPILVFGILVIFQKRKTLKDIGYILTGLGFLFLGIH